MTRRRLFIIGAWLVIIVGWVWYQRSSGESAAEIGQSFVDSVRGAWWAIALYIGLYTVRPVVLFPATVLTLAGGILFGPVVGVIATIIGANLSALFAYWLARSIAPDRERDGADRDRLLNRWADRMRNNSFSTILTMRFLFLPYDLVAYAAGFLRIAPLQFLAATAIGSLPGTVAFVLLGASIERIDEGVGGLDFKVLVISGVLFVTSLGTARWLKQREVQSTTTQSNPQTSIPESASQ